MASNISVVCNTRSLLLLALIFSAGLGGGSQGGINALSGLIYPPTIRATGAGWALGLGRLGGIAGPVLGGLQRMDIRGDRYS